MAKTFLPKKVALSKEVIKKLKEEYGLSDENILDVEYWNDIHSPYTGVVIDTDEERQYNCYPYERTSHKFLGEYLGGVIWD